jgi:hypothetical protein
MTAMVMIQAGHSSIEPQWSEAHLNHSTVMATMNGAAYVIVET